MNEATFDDLDRIPSTIGSYEIHTSDGVPLKAGISANLRKRLRQHRDSKQSRLCLIPGGNWSNPGDVRSNRSILAKHLFFDRSLSTQYNLEREADRQCFLRDKCFIRWLSQPSRDVARVWERKREKSGRFRYCGRVRRR